MIRDKITPILKNKFIEEIKISREKGIERGFFICADKEGNLTPSKTCEGDVCNIPLDPKNVCPIDTQGDFHTHPYLIAAKKELTNRGETIPSDEILTKLLDDNIRKLHERIGVNDITINSPSYDDVLRAFLSKYIGITKGTICTASDLGKEKVECWTAKDIEDEYKRKIYAAKANSETRKRVNIEEGGLIEQWIVSVFDREIINLKE